ncbi:MAG: ribonuclease HII [Methanomassiliicoccales archaeon]
MICGVDEAGRGPVMGPMVVAAVMIEGEGPLTELGVKDSKQLTPARRSALSVSISEICQMEVRAIGPEEIDHHRGSMSLNAIEVEAFASLINRLRPRRAFVDAVDVDPGRMRSHLEGMVGSEVEVTCQHRADECFPVVSAASIVAKVIRDRLMREVEEELGGPVGSGYAHDPVTRAFLEKWIRDHGDLPPHTRRSWITAKRMVSLSKVARLGEWTD